LRAQWEHKIGAAELDANRFTFPTGANPRLLMGNPAGDLFWLDDDGVRTLHY
jgi:hypothetical protein